LLAVLILLAAAPSQSSPLLEAQSATPLAAFSTCFAQAQERIGKPWAYLPGERGGTFTDSGAHGATASYWLQVSAAGAGTDMRLYSDARADALPRVRRAIGQCR
jgi:hypothetical protein